VAKFPLVFAKVPLQYRPPSNVVEAARESIHRFMILRLAKFTLDKVRDVTLAALGRTDVESVKERAAIDLRKCEVMQVLVKDRPLLLVIIAGAFILVQPDDVSMRTGVCVSVAPIHCVKRVGIKLNSSLEIFVKSLRALGLANKSKTGEWVVEVKFDSEVKALFAKDQIERAASRTAQLKLSRIAQLFEL